MSPERASMSADAHAVVIVPLRWVYDHLICEFDHWDICLNGLVDRNGERWFCEVCGDGLEENIEYKLRPVSWNAECDEYLEDYRVAYKHWLYEYGRRPHSYNGWDLSWFHDKWQGRNPIAELAR